MSDKIIIPGDRANLAAELRERVIENGKLQRALAETTGTIKSYAAQDAQILAKIEEDAATIARLRAALAPFARTADIYMEATSDGYALYTRHADLGKFATEFTLGDLREARAALKA